MASNSAPSSIITKICWIWDFRSEVQRRFQAACKAMLKDFTQHLPIPQPTQHPQLALGMVMCASIYNTIGFSAADDTGCSLG